MTVRPAKTQISLGIRLVSNSLGIRPVWSESSLCAQWAAIKGPKLSSCGQWRLWSDWADAQADLSLRWAHMPFCRFCREAAQIIILHTPPTQRLDGSIPHWFAHSVLKYMSKVTCWPIAVGCCYMFYDTCHYNKIYLLTRSPARRPTHSLADSLTHLLTYLPTYLLLVAKDSKLRRRYSDWSSAQTYSVFLTEITLF